MPEREGREGGGSPGRVSRQTALYDALLDDYEPGAKSGELAVLFQSLREQLVPLVQVIGEAASEVGRGEGRGDPQARYPLIRQNVFGEAVAGAVGFDFQRGRLDVTAHPFCTGIGPGDTGSPPGTTSTISARPSSASCTRSATVCTSRGCRRAFWHAAG